MATAKLKIKLNYKGFRELRTNRKAVQELERRGRNVKAAGGSGMEMSTYVGRQRARVTVYAATPAAKRREAKSRSLTRALDAGRR